MGGHKVRSNLFGYKISSVISLIQFTFWEGVKLYNLYANSYVTLQQYKNRPAYITTFLDPKTQSNVTPN